MMRNSRGQYALEWAVLMTAMVTAFMLMQKYVVNSISGNVKSTEMQLNGAMQDNRP